MSGAEKQSVREVLQRALQGSGEDHGTALRLSAPGMPLAVRPTLLIALLTLLPLSSQNPAGPPVLREQPAAPIGTATLGGLAAIDVNGQLSPVRRAHVIVQGDNGTSQTTDTDTSGRFRVVKLSTA
jgi:hypothetical protein